MGQFARKRRVALGAAWAATYALVLNVLLASALLAAQSPAQLLAGHEFCRASEDAATPVDPGKAKPAAIHCPLCIGHHVSAAPPPVAPAVAIRLAFGVAYDPPRPETFVALTQARDHQPRGPPVLS
ncbi:hypothetical protein IP86_12220 [Rhodopseudomonas sp. AAP120]|uniref:DUF2946 family protein n=1 Tax=Rhodopseudomonas sp. AAP120 TaxID=1523430 RepID=UPI0006B99A33|nr:DUF2946 family protein [Rhodopseudomonas sp. AAP120]KPF98213.1 hypothetical protein IP86_12220 [Rhodopseudomonas sp. AAP120]